MANVLKDFPADRFEFMAFCSCGHSAAIDRTKLPEDLAVDALSGRLRCGACGSREARLRIVWTAAGGFSHFD